jgi:hypothetical protein
LDQGNRILHHARRHFEKGITDIERIDGGGAVVGGLALDPVGYQLAALLGDLDHRSGELEGIGKAGVSGVWGVWGVSGVWGVWGVCLAHARVTGAFLSFDLAESALEA